MIYVMSDLHGDYEKYKKMLELIKFSNADDLYVLGDVVDRGPKGLAILLDMSLRANVIPIMGNHEYMARKCFKLIFNEETGALREVSEDLISNLSPQDLDLLMNWINHNGGQATIDELKTLSDEQRVFVGEYLDEFETCSEITVADKSFLLVHAGLNNFHIHKPLAEYRISDIIFCRTDYTKEYYPDKYLVTGHTPTRRIFASELGLSMTNLSDETYRQYDKVYSKHNHIAIDCGCGYGGRLACVCIDTLEEFYID